MPPLNATAAAPSAPVLFAGLPSAAWFFALRAWIAVVLALYVAFRLELASAGTAALTVAILLQPTRGQGIQRAFYRLTATLLGVVVSVAAAAAFGQSPGLMLMAFAVFTGACVYAGTVLDGNRSYAAATAIITFAFVAIDQLDAPAAIFDAGINRGAAVAIGVIVSAIVGDVLAAPDYYPRIAEQLAGLRAGVAAYAVSLVRGETPPPDLAPGLLRDISVLRPEIDMLASESSSGAARAAAARAAMVGLVAELAAARSLRTLQSDVPPDRQARFAAAMATGAAMPEPDPSNDVRTRALDWQLSKLVQRSEALDRNLTALREGSYPHVTRRAARYRPTAIAFANAWRAAAYIGAAAILLSMAGLPQGDGSLAVVAIIIALSSAAPDPRPFVRLAILATPVAVALAAILEFVVLDGVDGFPLLAIGLAPVVIGCALLITRPNPQVVGFARLSLAFSLAVLMPTNPQSYNPQTLLNVGFFTILGAALLFVMQVILPPPSPQRRLALLMRSIRGDLARPRLAELRGQTPEELFFRAASRISQMMAADLAAPANAAALRDAMADFDRSVALRRAEAALLALRRPGLEGLTRAAGTALDRRDGPALLALSQRFAELGSDPDIQAVSATLALAGLPLIPEGAA